MTKTVKGVKPKPQASGNAFYVNGYFDDGSGFSAYAKTEDDGLKVIEQLTGLIGKPGEFEVEPKPDYNGQKQWKLKGWPGKPTAGRPGGGGFGGRTESYAYSKEGFGLTQRSIQMQTALKCACEVSIAQKLFSADTIIDLARSFAAFLTEDVGAASTKSEDALKDFLATLKAADAERKSSGLPRPDRAVVSAAIALRGWKVEGFQSWSELQESLGPAKFKQLTKAIDLAPMTFEKESRTEEQQ